MAEQSTFIKVDRNILGWRWFKDPNTLQVWLWLLINANIKDHDFRTDTIRRGEVATSRKSIMQDTKLTEMQVRTALNHLKATGEITVRHGPNYQVITIVHFDKYQAKVTGSAPGAQPGRNRVVTGSYPQSKNDKTGNMKERENVCVATTHTPTITQAVEYFRARGRSQADAEKFFNFNQSRGWMNGQARITDWQSAAEMWIGQRADIAQPTAQPLDEWGKPIKPEFWNG